MGREARCACRWGERAGNVSALLEASEVIVRGEVQGRAPLAAIEALRVSGDRLEFSVANEPVALVLGAVEARRWAEKIAPPPPTLAKKLGIDGGAHVHTLGIVDDEFLAAALAIARRSDAPLAEAGLVLLRTDEPEPIVACVAALRAAATRIPLWVVYRKGRGARLGEAAVRTILRDLEFVDVKVASVSATLTALRFDDRRAKA